MRKYPILAGGLLVDSMSKAMQNLSVNAVKVV